jgi:hypothetical protein
MEIDFDQDQLVRFDLPTFADIYPEQWKERNYNTVQLKIEFLGLQFFNVSGWKGEIIADIKINRLSNNTISLAIVSSHCNVQAIALRSKISSIQGYINNVFGRATL